MINIIEEFDKYLTQWSSKNKVSKPSTSADKNWRLAWKDFSETYLIEHYEELRQQYLSNEFSKKNIEQPVKEETNWEIVKNIMEQ